MSKALNALYIFLSKNKDDGEEKLMEFSFSDNPNNFGTLMVDEDNIQFMPSALGIAEHIKKAHGASYRIVKFVAQKDVTDEIKMMFKTPPAGTA